MIAPPPVYVFLTKSKTAQVADLSSIKVVVNRAAPIAPSVVEALCKRLNMDYVINGVCFTNIKYKIEIPWARWTVVWLGL